LNRLERVAVVEAHPVVWVVHPRDDTPPGPIATAQVVI